jgi:hypothetical protein
MKLNRVQHVIATTLPALLGLNLALAALGGTSETPTDFPAEVAFELGKAEFLPGDIITIQQVRGTSSTIVTGGTYCVEGTYTLASREEADLALFATTMSDVPTPIDPSQHTRIAKGTGNFRLVKTVRQEGYLHVSFYPVSSGGDFGGVYFGQGKWVLHLKASDRHQQILAQDHPMAGASTGKLILLKGPNRELFEYLGDPVDPPANMDAAYTKDGLINAIQTAARKAGIPVKRVEVEDSEFPFLVGLVCKEGDFSKLTEQLRKLAAYEYNGCISTSTHSAFNMVPYRVFPSQVSQRISHRTGLRCQIFFDKLTAHE